jgi:hypothetical protein
MPVAPAEKDCPTTVVDCPPLLYNQLSNDAAQHAGCNLKSWHKRIKHEGAAHTQHGELWAGKVTDKQVQQGMSVVRAILNAVYSACSLSGTRAV